MAGGTLFIKVLPEKGAEAAISKAVERGGQQAEGTAKDSGGRWGLGFAAAAGAAIGKGLQGAAALEQVEVSLTTMLGSAGAARDMLGELTDFARETPFEMQGLAANARQLLGVGAAAEDVIPTLQVLGDASAALGLNQEQMDRVLRAVTQSMAKGKFQAEEMMQMAEAGIPIYDLMARAVGGTESEMLAMAENGELLSGDVLPKLLAVMQEDYAGGMVAQSKTLNGIISTLKDDINLGLAEAVEGLLPLLKDLLPSAGKAAGGVITAFGVALKVVATLAYPFVQALDALLEGFGSLPAPIQVAIVAALLLGRVMGGLGLVGVIKGMWAVGTAMYGAAAGATTLRGALTAMGVAAAGAAGRVGFGALISTLVGGGWGLAIIAIGTVIAGIMNVVNQADEARDHIEQLVGDVSIGANGRATAAAIRELNDEIARNEEILKGRGMYANWAVPEDNNIAEATDKIEELNEAQERYNENSKRLADQLGITVGQLEALALAEGLDLDLLAGDAEDVARFKGELLEANGAVEAGFDPTSALGEAMATYADEASNAAEKSDAFRLALEALTGQQIGVADASRNWHQTLRDLEDAFMTTNEEGEEVFNDLAAAAVDAAGKLDVTTEAGGGLHDAFTAARDAMLDSAQAAYDAAVANGDLAGASAAAGAAADQARQDFINQLLQMDLSEQQANALADAYGFIPGSVVTAIGTPGMTQAQLAAAILKGKVEDVPDSKTVITSALTADAVGRLEALGFKVTTLPDGRVQVTADTESADATIRDFLQKKRVTSIQVNATINRGPGVQGFGLAEGGRLDFLAGGGMRAYGHSLSPMSAHWAKVVPANTWRVVGDRPRGREWYVPEGAPNTLPVLEDAAAAHGLQLVRAMAEGGLLGGKPIVVPAGTSRVTNIENNLYATPTLPTADQLQRVMRESEVLAGA